MAIKILIIDDDLDVQKVLKRVLTKEGYEVIPASNGKEGVKLAEKIIPNLIMCDIKMPEIDGFEVERLIKINEKTQKIPIIMITAVDSLAAIRESFKEGAIGYITKPFDFEKVKKKINLVLRVSGQLLTESRWTGSAPPDKK